MIVVMPMAGRGSRFSSQGVVIPKPLINVAGRPMFSWAAESLNGLSYSKFVAIVLEEHQSEFNISDQIHQHIRHKVEVVSLNEITDGQLCSVLAAKSIIDVDEPILVMPSDTLVISDLNKDISMASPTCKGIISVAEMTGDHWSFAKIDESLKVLEVAEKIRISNYASTGMYYFSRGRELVETAEEMIAQKEKTKGEYYVIPVYGKYLKNKWEVRASIAQQLWDMGNPEALERFQKKFG